MSYERTPEYRALMSARIKESWTPERRAKHNYERTTEHRAQMAALVKEHWTPERRAKHSEITKGRSRSEETLEKLSAARFRGGKSAPGQNYVLIRAPRQKQKLEHRVVMENHIGRTLRTEEEVHHDNGNRQDNRIENLRLFANHAEHMAFHASERRRRMGL